MHRVASAALALLVAVTLHRRPTAGSTIPVARCNPASHICEGRCPSLPPWADLPPEEGSRGVCLWNADTSACVCWLRNPAEEHRQVLFKCEAASNGTVKHVMCVPPDHCFPPGASGPGCMIVLQCPCILDPRSPHSSRWHQVVALILRSKTPVSGLTPVKEEEETPDKPQGDVREFSVKHLLFLLAFVIAPLLCWCLLTFFHEGKCRKRRLRRPPESEPMPTERVEEVEGEPPPTGSECAAPSQQQQQQSPPTAPKLESPPPYREALDPEESCLMLAADCGPPPSYEDAIRDQRWQVAVHRIQDV